MMPLVLVNSQLEPDRLLRSRAWNLTRIRVVASTGRMPPSGTTIVWSVRVAATGTPSTVTEWSWMLPSRAAMVFSSIRSIGAPDVLRIVAVESTRILRVPHEIRSEAS
jgi:hypothetical protein